jgi:hypothetical protein
MPNTYFISLFKDIQECKFKTNIDYNSPKIVNKEELTPKTRTIMKKIKSEEDFVKLQVPWIL